MRQHFLLLIFLLILSSCDRKYEIIDEHQLENLSIQDTLKNTKKIIAMKVGDSISDEFPALLIKSKDSNSYYLFDYECELQDDSTVVAYSPAFIYDEDGGFKKNGIWVYTKFYTEGTFPFTTEGIKFSVDSIPKNWNKPMPKKEGIYFLKNESLFLLSNEQSESKFKENKLDGFYFIPNSGRLFDKINISEF